MVPGRLGALTGSADDAAPGGVIGRDVEDDLVADDEPADDMSKRGGKASHEDSTALELYPVECFGKHFDDPSAEVAGQTASLFVTHSISSSFLSLSFFSNVEPDFQAPSAWSNRSVTCWVGPTPSTRRSRFRAA
jgi:hypothetical protein